MEKKLGPSHAALVKDGVDWLRRQQPRDLYLTSYDGLRLHARWVPAEHPKGTVVLFHGWRSSIVGDLRPSMPAYHDLGFHLLLVDQRGQNGSEGKYITFWKIGKVEMSGPGWSCTIGSLVPGRCFWAAFPWERLRFCCPPENHCRRMSGELWPTAAFVPVGNHGRCGKSAGPFPRFPFYIW